jgi:hypothetical protein
MIKTKLKKNITKKKDNKTSKKKKMIGGNNTSSIRRSQRGKSPIEMPVLTLGAGSPVNTPIINISSIRRSQRGKPTIEMPVLTLGIGSPVNPTYNNQVLADIEIKTFVENQIKPGYQIVCLPMPPDQSHSIIAHVLDDNSVMIVDWGGAENRNKKRIKWKNYTRFIKYLEIKYGKDKVRYYPIDNDIYGIACQRYDTNNGQGGCSEYVHNWINKYIGQEGQNAIIFT